MRDSALLGEDVRIGEGITAIPFDVVYPSRGNDQIVGNFEHLVQEPIYDPGPEPRILRAIIRSECIVTAIALRAPVECLEKVTSREHGPQPREALEGAHREHLDGKQNTFQDFDHPVRREEIQQIGVAIEEISHVLIVREDGPRVGARYENDSLHVEAP
jgi:hypothetical protein